MFGMDGDAKFNFGCKPLDFVCPVMEDFSTSLVRFITDLIESMVKDGRQVGAGSNIWGAIVSHDAQGAWWTVGIVITLLTGIVGMASAAIRMDKQGLFRAILAMLLSMPITVIVLRVIGAGIREIDYFSSDLLTGALGNSIISVFSDPVFRAPKDITGPVLGAEISFWQIVIMLLWAFVGALFMSFALAFRDLILILLIAFAPVAFAAMPLRQGSVWIQRWASAVISMVLAKPLMFGALKLFSVMLSSDKIEPFSVDAIPIYLGMILSAFMPLMAYSFFNFVGSVGSDQVGSQAAVRGRQQLSSLTHNMRGLSKGAGASRVGGAAAGAGAGAAAAGAGAALSAGKAAKGAVAGQAANASNAASQSNTPGAAKPNSGSASPQTSSAGSPSVPANAQNNAGGAKNSGQQLRNAGSQGRFGDSPPPKQPKIGGSS